VRDVVVAGVRVRFSDCGSGPPLLLVHDFLDSRSGWGRVVEDLASSFRVIAPDLPGFGESERPSPSRYDYSPHAFAESVTGVLDALGIDRVCVCGQGLGGAVALALAQNCPTIVSALVVASPLLDTASVDRSTKLARTPLVGPFFYRQLYSLRLFRGHFLDRLAIPASSDIHQRIDDLFAQFDTPAGRAAAHATLVAMGDTRVLDAGIPKITMRTLVIRGERDQRMSASDARRLVRDLPKGRLETLPCGSNPALECPTEFASLVAAFASRTVPTARRMS
jgi:pimeloyl-ACP methyl ester carboxylesterase